MGRVEVVKRLGLCSSDSRVRIPSPANYGDRAEVVKRPWPAKPGFAGSNPVGHPTPMTILNAKQAVDATRRAEARIARERRRQDHKDAMERERVRHRILKHDVPLRMRGLKKALSKAVCEGHRELRFEVNNYTEGHAIRERLEKKGYTVSSVNHEHGTNNMGDFNAPCNVEYDNYWIIISWT